MARTIPQRELRNDVSRVLREVAAGEEVTVTVRGEPVAELRPAREGPRRFVPGATALAVLRRHGPDRKWLAEHRGDRDQLGYLEEL